MSFQTKKYSNSLSHQIKIQLRTYYCTLLLQHNYNLKKATILKSLQSQLLHLHYYSPLSMLFTTNRSAKVAQILASLNKNATFFFIQDQTDTTYLRQSFLSYDLS